MNAATRRNAWQQRLLSLLMLTAIALLGSCSSSQVSNESDPSTADGPSQVHVSSDRNEADTNDQETPSPSEINEPPSSEPTTPSASVDEPETEQPTSQGSAEALPLSGRVIVVDPGHNGGNYRSPSIINAPVDAGGFQKACNTTGTASGSYSEAQLNWEVSQRLKHHLEAAGAQVVLTRDSNDGVGPCINERGGLTNSVGADALISIHADGSSAGNHGFHIIIPTATGIVSEEIADASHNLGEMVRDELVNALWQTSTYLGTNGIHARGDLGTLNHSTAPAILAELGNMHHENDLARMRSDEGQESIAQAITSGLTKFLT